MIFATMMVVALHLIIAAGVVFTLMEVFVDLSQVGVVVIATVEDAVWWTMEEMQMTTMIVVEGWGCGGGGGVSIDKATVMSSYVHL